MKASEFDAREKQGLCGWCGLVNCLPTCERRKFMRGYAVGFHDGCNNLERHGHAFIVEMIEDGVVEND